jgi:hypothetical protein
LVKALQGQKARKLQENRFEGFECFSDMGGMNSERATKEDPPTQSLKGFSNFGGFS